MQPATLITGLVALTTLGTATSAVAASPCGEFSDLAIHLEVNATDGDAEVVIFAKGGDDGLKSLAVTSPTGRITAGFFGSPRGIGIREFILESAEPPDLDAVLRSFPEGTYRVRGRTVRGECLKGTAFLSHVVAPAPVLLTPTEDAELALNGLVVTWEAVPDVASYVIGVDNEDQGTALVAESAASATSFTVPADWLEPGTAYVVSVAAKMPDGNVTSVETPFSTVVE